jgi:two-component system, NtrC family, response regulator AtoC
MADNTTSVFSRLSERSNDGGMRLMAVASGQISYFQLPKDAVLLIGRAADADIRVEDKRVSREHARLHLGERVEIEDLGSANGTVLHNQRIPALRRIAISPGEAIGIGGAVLVIQSGRAENDTSSSGIRPVREHSLATVLPKGAVVQDDAMRRVYELAGRVALGDVNVLIFGESGSGKELLAETIHRCSRRADKPFLSINCAALSESLLESELFGHERGAFTGANQSKPGLLESLPGGTLLLDEIGEMVPALQAKLLRALETKQVLRVGSSRPRPIDLRFISATNRVISDEVSRGQFRRDLYFRINTVMIHVPPLRERPSEILPLAHRFVETLFGDANHLLAPKLSLAAEQLLQAHSWPGNVRELRGAIQRALLLCEDELRPEHFDLEAARASAPTLPPSARVEPRLRDGTVRSEIADLERRRIEEVLQLFSGNQTRAAEHLGLSRRTLLNRLDEYGLSRPRKKPPS